MRVGRVAPSVDEELAAIEMMSAAVSEPDASPAEVAFLNRCERRDALVTTRKLHLHAAIASVAHPTRRHRIWHTVEKLVVLAQRDLPPLVVIDLLRILVLAVRDPQRGQREYDQLVSLFDEATQARINAIVGILGEAGENPPDWARAFIADARRNARFTPTTESTLARRWARVDRHGQERVATLTAAEHAPPVCAFRCDPAGKAAVAA